MALVFSCLFTHQAVLKQHYHSFGDMFLATRYIYYQSNILLLTLREISASLTRLFVLKQIREASECVHVLSV